jgi:ferredoxin
MNESGKFLVRLVNTGDQFGCTAQMDVLRAMEQLGLRGIPVGCRGGGCGVCRVRVLDGDYRLGRMSRACISEAQEAAGEVLACKLYPRADLVLEVTGCMVKSLLTPRPAPALRPGA